VESLLSLDVYLNAMGCSVLVQQHGQLESGMVNAADFVTPKEYQTSSVSRVRKQSWLETATRWSESARAGVITNCKAFAMIIENVANQVSEEEYPALQMVDDLQATFIGDGWTRSERNTGMNIVLPATIGRYHVVELIGRGAMGLLFRAHDPVLGRQVAIKFMHSALSVADNRFRERFYREAQAIARLQHPNIISVFEFGEEQGTPYIVMEYLKGASLDELMNSAAPLSVDDSVTIVADLCDALHCAHEHGVIHRDVKPGNILILEDGSLKLIDFGIAKLSASTLTHIGEVVGTVPYMSPEQVDGAKVDWRSDIFSASVVLYELLSGKKPFDGETPTAIVGKILHASPAPLTSIARSLPHVLVTLVERGLSKNPAHRFDSADHLALALRRVSEEIRLASKRASSLKVVTVPVVRHPHGTRDVVVNRSRDATSSVDANSKTEQLDCRLANESLSRTRQARSRGGSHVLCVCRLIEMGENDFGDVDSLDHGGPADCGWGRDSDRAVGRV
jgi:serine/threonine protein kinase